MSCFFFSWVGGLFQHGDKRRNERSWWILPQMEERWTWTNQRSIPLCFRIDPFFISFDYLLQLAGVCQKVL